MTFWANLLGYQAVWFATIGGAARGLWWPGVVAAALFAAAHLRFGVRDPASRATDARLLIVAVVVGLVLDGMLARSGLVRYAASDIALPSGGAPLWILALWACFALTLRHSMAALIRLPQVAALAGAVFGPLAYYGVARVGAAATLSTPQWQPLLALCIGWISAMLIFAALARRWSPPRNVVETP
ncbi:MAG: DUF2878 domain-containing protein [Lysobacter sp.]|nr:DUF2878 domain-containing protein [Lysobacter sp.]